MTKDPVTGIVTNDPDACIGCRYCVYACPFGVPQYRVHEPATASINKCEMCKHLQSEGQDPGLLRRLPDRRLAVRQAHRPAARRSSGASP